MSPSLVSVNIGVPTTAAWAGQKGVTGIDKHPVAGPVRLAALGVTVVDRPDHGVTINLAFRALTLEPDLLARLLDAPQLPQHLRDRAARRAPSTVDVSR